MNAQKIFSEETFRVLALKANVPYDQSCKNEKTFQMGSDQTIQSGRHQRLVLSQLGNQLQAGGQVLKDCLIQCRCFQTHLLLFV